jgi:hypothetical protein
MPLDWDVRGAPGEVMAFVKDQLKVALQLGTFFTVSNISESWLRGRGLETIVPKQRARLHTLLNERLVKLFKKGLAIRQEGFAENRGQPAYGWRWDPTGVDLSEEY